MSVDTLKLLPLGGLGEIGMNCFVLQWKDEIVLLDCGIQFPDASYTGVELLAPDLSYLGAHLDHIKGIIVTHGHDDHIGAIPYLAREIDIDVYVTPFPRGLIENKLTEHSGIKNIRFHEITPREKFTIGSFTFDPIPVQHSIIESLAFAIETPVGTIIHTGDFKHDDNEVNGQHIGLQPFQEWGDKGVYLLLSDSTNAERPGHTISEVDIEHNFEEIFAKQTGRLIVALFASNIRRIGNLLRIAAKQGKKVALAGRSMLSYTKLAHDQGSLDIPQDTLILLENTTKYPDKDVIVLATGSQAEPGSALVRVSQGVHKDIEIRSGDQVIMSSRFIPGNERNITSMIDQLYRAGAEVMYEAFHQIHVSGHGFQDELVAMLKATRPKFFVPVHGEYRHLKKHAMLAKQTGVLPENINVIENGQMLEATADTLTLGPKINIKKVAIVDRDILDTGSESFPNRNALAKTGVVFVALMVDKRTGKLWGTPRVAAHGLLYRQGEDPQAVLEQAIDKVEHVAELSAQSSEFTEILKLELRRLYKKRVSHKPLVIPLILEV
jgi:ribonuclease J